MKFTNEEMELLDRHYTKIRIFGKVILWWDTSPRAVLRHLQELKVKNFVQPDVKKSLPINKCNCSRCTGLPDIESYYRDEE